MPFRKPEDQTVGHWLLSGLNAKSIVLCAVAMCGVYYGLSTRVTVVEQKGPALSGRVDELEHRQDNQLQAIREIRETTVRRDTYASDQQRLISEFAIIHDALGRIEDHLMANK